MILKLIIYILIAMIAVSGVLLCVGWAIAKIMEGRKES